MSVEDTITAALEGLVADAFYPDQAPASCPVPYGVYQQVGGLSVSFLDDTVSSKRNGRFQVAFWATTRAMASGLMRQAHDILIGTAALQATALGELVADYDDEAGLYGARQDFSVWFDA